MSVPPGIVVRKFDFRDRDAVRFLCCQTGFLGKPIDPVFEDRELFADYLTSYYTDVEPESCFVLEQNGRVVGYLLGSRRPFRQQLHSFVLNIRLFLKGMSRYRGYNRATRDFIGWILRNSWREVPAAPRRTAHFHFNVLPEAQSVAGTSAMMNAYFDYLRENGERAVFGQMVTFESRRGAKVLERYGFRVLEKREITKWRDKHPEPVYLTTVIKQLDETKSSGTIDGRSDREAFTP
jgi:ribosomal protein S18 acetylase RimI-like enzyme